MGGGGHIVNGGGRWVVVVASSMQVLGWLLLLNINYCCGSFTDYISARAHYSRLHSTLVPSVACQTTEGKYHSTNPFPTY